MTNVEIVREAVKSLHLNKGIKLELLKCEDDGRGGVDTAVNFPKPFRSNLYGFTKDWFTSKRIDIESYSWMEGFEVPDILRKTHPDQVCILRIAYYFWKHGKTNKLF